MNTCGISFKFVFTIPAGRSTVNTSTWAMGLAPLGQAVSTNTVQFVIIFHAFVFQKLMILRVYYYMYMYAVLQCTLMVPRRRMFHDSAQMLRERPSLYGHTRKLLP